MDDKQPKERKNDDWDNRVLCSDGNCIGVIGPDRCCKECGKALGGPIDQGLSEEISTDAAVDNDHGEADNDTGAVDKDDGEADRTSPPSPEDTDTPIVNGDDWDNRSLCSDGNCIGVIGPDGRCKECGKPYGGEPEEDREEP